MACHKLPVITKYPASQYHIMNTTKLLYEVGQPKPATNLVESIPVQEGQKLSLQQSLSWEDLLGLCWINDEDW